jgi:hypothetical protein
MPGIPNAWYVMSANSNAMLPVCLSVCVFPVVGLFKGTVPRDVRL